MALCVECSHRPRRKPRSRICEVCYCHGLARKLCHRCGAEKEGEGRGRGKLCVDCRKIPWRRPGQACLGCGGKKRGAGRGAVYCPACAEARKDILCTRCHQRPRRDGDGPHGGCPRYCTECYTWSRERQAEHKLEYRRWHEEREVLPTNNNGGPRPLSAEFPDLPTAPLAKKINELVVRERCPYLWMPKFTNKNGGALPDGTRKAICARLGISERLLSKWNSGESPWVAFDIADGVLRQSAWLWFDVWEGDEMSITGMPVREIFEPSCETVAA